MEVWKWFTRKFVFFSSFPRWNECWARAEKMSEVHSGESHPVKWAPFPLRSRGQLQDSELGQVLLINSLARRLMCPCWTGLETHGELRNSVITCHRQRWPSWMLLHCLWRSKSVSVPFKSPTLRSSLTSPAAMVASVWCRATQRGALWIGK